MTHTRFLLTTCAILSLLLPTTPLDAASEPPDLSGVWELNEDRSQDPRAMMAEQTRNRSGRGSSVGGRGGARGGGRGGGRGGDATDGANRERLRSMQAGVETLTITHREPEVSILYANDLERSFFTDGRELEPEVDAQFIDEKAKWKGGDRLVVQGMSSRGDALKQVFEMSADGANLLVTTEVKPAGDRPKLEFLRVYDRVVDDPADS